MATPVGQSDRTAYIQEQFKGQHEAAVDRRKHLQAEFKKRRTVAYLVKAVVALGGLAITAGLKDTAAQIVGIVIAAGVILDSEVFSNHKRLLALGTAETAMRSLIEGVEYRHRVGLVPVFELREAKKEEEARKAFSDLLTKFDGRHPRGHKGH
jgi:hypothetical protein